MKIVNRLAKIGLAVIFLVILAGSIVRTTGSGMGCPDWPKCFGHLVPPTQEEQVIWHPNSKYNKGQMILHEEALWSAKEAFTSGEDYNAENWERYTKHNYAVFNATHTWIEYINRLIGAFSGLPILALFIFSFLVFKKDKWLVLLSAGTLLLLGYEAWLGKLVVDGNLVPFAITKHMFGSMGIVLLLTVIISRSGDLMKKEVLKSFRILLIVSLVLLAVQIFLGTQVREQIDEIALNNQNRHAWIGLLDNGIYVHRSVSLLVLALLAWLFWRNWRNEYAVHSVGFAFLFILLEVIIGAVMYYFHIPKILQPVHLMLSTGTFALLAWAIMRTKKLEPKTESELNGSRIVS